MNRDPLVSRGKANSVRIKGCDQFDESMHVLRCPKTGIGTRDAPRAFAVKLRKVIMDMKGKQIADYDVKTYELQRTGNIDPKNF